MDKIPELRSYMMIIRLKREPQYYQDDIERLKGALPACTKSVWWDNKVIALTTATEYEPREVLQHYGRALRPFANVGVYELGRLSASTYSSFDPLHLWMESNVRRGERREADEAYDMLQKKWGQRRIEDAENRSIADTFREVFARAAPRDDGSKDDGLTTQAGRVTSSALPAT